MAAIIRLRTFILAPPERVFDLSRSIDLHLASASGTGERVVAGVSSGLIGLGGEVTWEARHFGVRQCLRVRVTALERPAYFQDTMVKGAFRRMVHDHRFFPENGGTRMEDRFEFEAPFGLLGTIVEKIVLTGHLRRFLEARNRCLKDIAESEEWRRYLG